MSIGRCSCRVAQDCAQALDRARFFESVAQLARDGAEAADRLKEGFVSIVSHELRTAA